MSQVLYTVPAVSLSFSVFSRVTFVQGSKPRPISLAFPIQHLRYPRVPLPVRGNITAARFTHSANMGALFMIAQALSLTDPLPLHLKAPILIMTTS